MRVQNEIYLRYLISIAHQDRPDNTGLYQGSFSHASISLTKDLSEMYSFARYRAHNPFVGGLYRSFLKRLTMGKEAEVLIKIFEIPLTEEQYNKIRDFVYESGMMRTDACIIPLLF